MGPAAQAGSPPDPAGAGGEAGLGFAEAYERHARSLYGTALRMLRRPEDAEDAMQETFLIFHRRRAGLDPAQLGGWLKRVLVNQCIDRLRRRRRRAEREWTDDARQGPARQDGAALDLRAAVGALPERARMVFLLHDVEGFRHRDVAELLGISVGGSKSQLFRARNLLRARMEGES